MAVSKDNWDHLLWLTAQPIATIKPLSWLTTRESCLSLFEFWLTMATISWPRLCGKPAITLILVSHCPHRECIDLIDLLILLTPDLQLIPAMSFFKHTRYCRHSAFRLNNITQDCVTTTEVKSWRSPSLLKQEFRHDRYLKLGLVARHVGPWNSSLFNRSAAVFFCYAKCQTSATH